MSDYPPTPVPTSQTPSCGQDRVLCAMHELSEPSPGFGGFQLPNPTAPACRFPNAAALLYGPHLSAWSDTRRRDSGRHRLELSAAVLQGAAVRASISGVCKGSSGRAFITAQSNKAVA